MTTRRWSPTSESIPRPGGDFVDEFAFRLGVKTPGEAQRQANRAFIGRTRARANPWRVANPPDLTFGELVAIADAGEWPAEHLQPGA